MLTRIVENWVVKEAIATRMHMLEKFISQECKNLELSPPKIKVRYPKFSHRDWKVQIFIQFQSESDLNFYRLAVNYSQESLSKIMHGNPGFIFDIIFCFKKKRKFDIKYV